MTSETLKPEWCPEDVWELTSHYDRDIYPDRKVIARAVLADRNTRACPAPEGEVGELVERLKRAADEMRAEGQNGWPVTVDDAAEALSRLSARESVVELPNDDEPKSFEELAEAAIMDMRAYAYDEDHARRMVSVEAYEKRLSLLRDLKGGG